jgi:hypothetical protein
MTGEEETPPTLSIVSRIHFYSMTLLNADSLAPLTRSPGTANYTTQVEHWRCFFGSLMEYLINLPFLYTQWDIFRKRYDISSILSVIPHWVPSPTLFLPLILFIFHWLTVGRQLEEINFS